MKEPLTVEGSMRVVDATGKQVSSTVQKYENCTAEDAVEIEEAVSLALTNLGKKKTGKPPTVPPGQATKP